MSVVDKMLIKGIRSFDPENKHVVTFFRPLTLIVGPNGAGKTTIIECLKLSCTGELPPNARSGQSFIHDPKVSGETETKGQIKLRFKTAAGKDVVCIRSFQLTQKASKMEFKAIESVLQTINPHTGEKVCLSYRCADMDREIPTLMGVSKAILENVIFVHQDDSNWPLQDPSTLKKKFDDIFSATRYTKALEVIKKLHKDQAQEIKTYKLKLENLQTLKDAAYKLRDNISQDQEKSESLKSQIKDLERNIQGVDSKILHTEATLKELQNLENQILTSTTARSTLFRLKETQYAALAEENEDTDEELKEWQVKFEDRITLLESKISKLERAMSDEETKSSLLSQTIKDSSREIGKLHAESDAHMSLRRDRDCTIQEIFAKHNLGSLPEAPFSNEVAFNLTNRINGRTMDIEKDLNDKKKSNEMDLKFLWGRYVAANARCSEVEGQKQAKINSKASILKRMSEKEEERDLAERKLSNINLSHVDEREKILVERKTMALDSRDYETNINQRRTEIFSLEQKITALEREKDLMSSDSENRVKLKMKKDELENYRRQQKKILDEYKDKIRIALKGRVPADKDLKEEISHAFGSLRKEYDGLNSKSLEAEKEVKLVQMKIQDAKGRILKLQKDMEAKGRFLDSMLHSLVHMSLDIESFPNVLLEVMEKRDVQKSKYNIADGMRQMFNSFERVALAHHICPCCERPFSLEEEDDFFKKQRVKSASSAEHMKLLAVDSSNADSLFQQLDKLRMVYEEYVKIGKETIPLAEKDLKQLMEEDLDQKTQAFDDHLAEALAPLLKEKETVLQEHTNLKSKFDREYEDLEENKRSFQQESDKLIALSRKIKEYVDMKKGEKLKDLQEKLSVAESQLQKCETMKREITADLTKSKELRQNQDQQKRNIDDNLNYRKAKAEVDELTREIELLEKKKLSIGGKSTFEADYKRHSQERERLLSERNRCDGTLSVYQSNISKNKLDLKQAQYNDIDKKHFNQLIQLKTTEMANKDLDKYYNAHTLFVVNVRSTSMWLMLGTYAIPHDENGGDKQDH